jgi:hypothetical protein
MSSNLLGELVANNGTYFFSGGSYDGNIDQIIVRGNGILGIRVYVTNSEGELINVTNDYILHGDETYLPNGTRITPQNNDVFTRVIIVAVDGTQSGLELVLA